MGSLSNDVTENGNAVLVKRLDSLSTTKIKRLLDSLGIHDYRVADNARVVSLTNKNDLLKLFVNLAPFEPSDAYDLCLCKSSEREVLQVGAWEFEVRAHV
ncbi:MAG TPA: hypothetical protein VGK02_07140 [Candidatus Aquicultor sp.]|jgi:hypothetical protein